MTKFVVALLVLALALSACDDDSEQVEADDQAQAVEADDDEEAPQPEEDTEPQAVAFPQNDWECSEESAERIGQWLESYGEHQARMVTLEKPEHLELLERDGDPLSGHYRPVIALEYNRLSIDGRAVTRDFYGDLESLSRPIKREIEQSHARAEAEAELVGEEAAVQPPLLLIDKTVPKMALKTVFEALAEADRDTAILVFASPEPEPAAEAIPDELQSRLQSLNHDSREALEEADQQATADCPQIAAAFDEMESLSPEERMPRLRQSLPQAWLDCQCQGDMEFVSARLMWHPEPGIAVTAHRATISDILDQVAEHEHITWGDLW